MKIKLLKSFISNQKMKKTIILIFLVLMINFVYPTTQLSNTSIITGEYSQGDNLQGVLNISISNEEASKEIKFMFSSSEERKKTLKDFLDIYKINNNSIYSCNPSNCGNNFNPSGNAETSKTFSISSNKKASGFVLSGNDVEIVDLSFDVSSDVNANCISQLSVDISADNVPDWENNKFIDESCGSDKISTCYNENSFDSWFLIGQEPYCEKIIIGKSPAFEVKSLMKSKTDATFSSDLLIAKIYDFNNELRGSCNFGKPESDNDGSLESCIINYVSKSDQNHSICISIKEGSNNDGYSLKARDSGKFCGFKGDPSQVSTTSADYYIKISPKKYDAIGLFTLNNTVIESQTGSSLIAELNNFVLERYSKNCPSEGCIIPLVFSGISQQIVINNINLKYKNSASNQVLRDKIYLMDETPTKITTNGFTLINLNDNEIKVPNNLGNYTFKLFLGTEKILEKNITVKEKKSGIIEQIYPTVFAATVPTKFFIFINDNDLSLNVSELTFEWDFSDGNLKKTSNKPFIQHTLSEIKTYKLKIKALDGSEVISSNEFDIYAKAPIQAVNQTIKEYKERINSVKIKKSALPVKYQTYINSSINFNEIESKINSLESQYLALIQGNASNENEFVSIMQELNNERVPRDILTSQTTNLVLLYELENLNLDDFSSMFNQEYSESQSQEYKNAIFSWFTKNLDVGIKHKTYSLYYSDLKDTFASEFEINIHPKYPLTNKGYLIIEKNKENIDFDGSYNPLSNNDITGLEIDLSQDSSIKFSLNEEINNPLSLSMYFAPEFSELNIIQPYEGTQEKGLGFWSKFLIGLSISLIILFIIYIFLRKWYKEKYESHLFKNKNDLYNLINFIRTSKARGVSDHEIKEKLIKAKWKREQISHALNKLFGKKAQ